MARMRAWRSTAFLSFLSLSISCGSSSSDSEGGADGGGTGGAAGSGNPAVPADSDASLARGDGGAAAPACKAEGGAATVQAPTLLRKLKDAGRESWLASPAASDLDGDGKNEIVVARGGQVFAWRSDG